MNEARGEVGLVIGGRERRLCLTLGALAEIEAAFGCDRMSDLDARMRALSAADLGVVLGTGAVSPGAAAGAVAEAFRLGLAG